jgi:hypothetical protein
VPVGTAGALTWLAPMTSVNRQTVRYFPRYSGQIPAAVLGISSQTIPTGAILGAGIGVISGLAILLARRWPRLVGWFLAVLFVSCVIGSVHIIAFDRVVDFVVQSGLEGVHRLMVPWTVRLELPTAIGATAGAFVGAVVPYVAVRLSDGTRRSRRN